MSSSTGSVSRWFGRVFRQLRFLVEAEPTAGSDGRGLHVEDIEQAIVNEILRSGIRTRFKKSLVFNGFIVAYVSPQAFASLRHVQSIVVQDLESHLTELCEKEGWTVISDTFVIQITESSQLKGLKVKVVTNGLGKTALPAEAQSLPRASIKLRDPKADRVWVIHPDRESRVGRKGSGLEVEIDSPSVSRFHASLKPTRGADGSIWGLVVRDEGSSYGTTVNGKPVLKNSSLTAQDGQVVSFSDVELTLSIT